MSTEEEQERNPVVPDSPSTGSVAEDEELTPEEFHFENEHRDWMLQAIVGVCNFSGIEISITLVVEGAYITGQICSPEVYFDGVISGVRSGTFSGPSGEGSRRFIEETLVQLKQRVTPETKPGVNLEMPTRALHPRYIHLRDARFFVPNDVRNAFPATPSAWWRGKITVVSGFFLGSPFEPRIPK